MRRLLVPPTLRRFGVTVCIVLLLGFLWHCRVWTSCPCKMTLQNACSCSVVLGDQWHGASAVSRSRRQPCLWLMGEHSRWVIHWHLPAGSQTTLCSPACKVKHKIAKQCVKLTRFCYTSTAQTAVRPLNLLTVWMLQLVSVTFMRKYSVRNSERKLCASITKTAQLMLCREVIAVCFQICINHKYKMWAEHRDFNVTSGSVHGNTRGWEKEHYSVC